METIKEVIELVNNDEYFVLYLLWFEYIAITTMIYLKTYWVMA